MSTPTIESQHDPIPSNFKEPLTAHDRCDACGARAYVRFHLSDGPLLFCAHHARQHRDVLGSLALHVHDESEELH